MCRCLSLGVVLHLSRQGRFFPPGFLRAHLLRRLRHRLVVSRPVALTSLIFLLLFRFVHAIVFILGNQTVLGPGRLKWLLDHLLAVLRGGVGIRKHSSIRAMRAAQFDLMGGWGKRHLCGGSRDTGDVMLAVAMHEIGHLLLLPMCSLSLIARTLEKLIRVGG